MRISSKRKKLNREGTISTTSREPRNSTIEKNCWDASPSREFTWSDPPKSVLSHIFDLLDDPRDLAAAACTCRAWAQEGSRDHRWQTAWSRDVSNNGLWRWCSAAGGYREQLRAKASINKGNPVATVFPFNRRDGPVSEVLMLDIRPEPLILTVQHSRSHQRHVRLTGATIKVWTASALTNQRPLMIVYDVIKHIQLEDGKLFCWRIADDAFVRMRCYDPENSDEVLEAQTWTEHPSIVASILDPSKASMTDVQLDSSYGKGNVPFEWIDMCSDAVATVSLSKSPLAMTVRLLDLESGLCFRDSSCEFPRLDEPEDTSDFNEVILSRNSKSDYQILASAALFDCRVFGWRLRDDWLTQEARATGIQQKQQEKTNFDVNFVHSSTDEAYGDYRYRRDDASSPLVENQNGMARAELDHGPRGLGGHISGEYQLHHIFTTPREQSIVDISISTTAGYIYVLGVQYVWILGEDGTLLIQNNMCSWQGASRAVSDFPFDVGAFSWPLPNSSQAAFYQDASNAFFLIDFNQKVSYQDLVDKRNYHRHAPLGRYPELCLTTSLTSSEEPEDLDVNWYNENTVMHLVQSHFDLRLKPSYYKSFSSSTGRQVGPSRNEQVFADYTQAGDVLFTTGDSACPSTAALLKAEKSAGTYLQGLGPDIVQSIKNREPVVVKPGNGGRSKASIAPRALICIDASTGYRYKAIPVEGSIESAHSAGHFVTMAIGPIRRGQYCPEGLNGALVVLDFTEQGFGIPCQDSLQMKGLKRKGTDAQGWDSSVCPAIGHSMRKSSKMFGPSSMAEMSNKRNNLSRSDRNHDDNGRHSQRRQKSTCNDASRQRSTFPTRQSTRKSKRLLNKKRIRDGERNS